MTHCRECNSEIAEAEAFCPYCGISIKPSVVVPDTTTGEIDAASESGDLTAEGVDSTDKSEREVDAAPAPDVDSGAEAADSDYVDISALKEDSVEEPEASDDRSEDDQDEAEEQENGIITTGDLAENAEADEKEADPGIDAEAEAEIDEAVSVIDRKADKWRGKVEDESPATDEPAAKGAPLEAVADIEAAGVDAVVPGDSKGEEVPPETPDVGEPDQAGEVEAEAAGSDVLLEAIADKDDSPSEEITGEETGPDKSALDDAGVPLAVDADTGLDSQAIDPEMEATLIDVSINASPEPETPVILAETPESDPLTEPPEAEEEQVVESGVEVVEPASSDEPVLVDPEQAKTEIAASDEMPAPDDSGDRKVDVSAGLGRTEPPDSRPVEFHAADIAEEGAEAASGAEDAVEETGEGEEKQYTTPNIGNVDTDGSNAQKLRPLDEGTVLNDRYEIVRKIGGGGMGAVYLASDRNLGGVLRAVKEMVQSYIEREQQEKAVQDFKRESMLLTSLEHSAIPTIYDYFYDEKEARFYLVMKYISGGDLAARLRAAPEGRLDEISVTQWAIEVSDVLSYLHNRQPPIVYRDLKPANIMIDGNSSKIMLIDFGIARWINKEEKGVTAVGTMGYAPPELFSGNVVPSSDIYSLGSTMFHLLTGADPQNNPLLIFDFQKHPRPRQINPNLSDQMERILMRSVEYNADGRFASAAEMRDELKRHLQGLKSGQVSYGIKESPAAVALSDQPVFCGFCGQKIVATDMFCAFCGAKQPLAQPGVHSQDYVLQQATARLVVEGTGELSVPSFDLGKKENLVGRRDPMSNIFPEVDLSKYDPQTKISRKHARIWREGETYMLEDLGSSNGTVLIQSSNDTTRLAPHQSRPLSHGDKIQVGDTMLHFVLG